FTTVKFAHQIQHFMNAGYRQITFVIGGAFGFSEEVYEKADEKLSLSSMTTTHQLIRLFFVEQLYRSFSIINNHPYHNE
ncbi:MAG TPA: 23S rRNA (pseudouridine(1915)-N(3))-methyltransferase RlmH, partial [Bacteroidales bacterium]|nr:23S rRNA (pseudouridine(1915)-N(3))-methyltransferase RlmH [Bacteroidales bacterium]